MPESSAYLKPEVLARIARLGLRANHVIEGAISGLHRSPMHGVSVEFADYREYAPGDDLKKLDWRVYARSDRFYIKRFEEESNLRATIVLDASASMKYGRGPMTKFDYAATLAASMAALLIKQRDAVGLVTFDSQPRTVLRPSATQLQLAKVIDSLEATKLGGETELGTVLAAVADRIKRRGLVILITDLLADLDSLYGALSKLQYAGHEILIFQVLDPDEIDLPFDDSVIFRDIEGAEEIYAEPWAFRKAYRAEMEKFIATVTARCRSGGIDHLLLKTTDDLGLALSHYLHQRLRRGPVKHGGSFAHIDTEEPAEP